MKLYYIYKKARIAMVICLATSLLNEVVAWSFQTGAFNRIVAVANTVVAIVCVVMVFRARKDF